MSAAFKQSASTDAGSSTLGGIPFASNCTSGSLFFGFFMGDNISAYTIQLSDTVNGNWTIIGAKQAGTGGLAGIGLQMGYFLGNTSTATPSVVATLTGADTSAFNALGFGEYTGVTSPESSSYASTSASQTSPSISSSVGAAVVAVTLEASSITSYSAPFTIRENANLADNGYGDDVGAAGGSITWTSVGGSGNQVQGIASFPVPASGPIGAFQARRWRDPWKRARSGIVVPEFWLPRPAVM
jgi:hypothetical protein